MHKTVHRLNRSNHLGLLYLLVQPEIFATANVHRNLKSLDISFHRLQQGLAVRTYVF